MTSGTSATSGTTALSTTSKGSGTALVTGASSGLGEVLAGLFAADKHNVVLVARSQKKLEEIKDALEKKHGVQAWAIAEDLADPAAPRRIFDQLNARGVTVDFLVNNAGFGSNGAFLDLDLDAEMRMVEVNVSALMKLTHLFVRGMRDRKAGRILNIGSTAGFQPGPFMATYYATKAFVISFSEALAYELKGSGVTVTCHCPGATATGFAARAGNDKSRLFQRSGVATADEVARHAYRAMMRGDAIVVHGALNFIGVAGVRFTPRPWVRALAARFNQRA
jgi:short-subunit dehydrogenase